MYWPGLTATTHKAVTALPAAMRYIFKAESYEMRWARGKTVLHNSGKCCMYLTLL